MSLWLSALCQGRYPKIVSGPSDPLIVRREDKATLNWTLGLPPSETWNSSIFEVVFGIWKPPGFLKTKLLAIDRYGEVLIRPNYEKKISCDFNMTNLRVAFILHDLNMKDENDYCLQVELGLHQSPLTDPVKLLLEDSPKIISPKKRNFSINIGDNLRIKSKAKGLPTPNITWTRQGRIFVKDTLVLKGVTSNDSGVYLCSAHSQAGEDHKEILVTVMEHKYGSKKPAVPHIATRTSSDGSPVWLFPVVIAVSVSVIAVVVVFGLRGRHCKRNIRYEQHIDIQASHSTTATI
ncbi:Hemolin [Stylophora pistillata]|uniref:Hemolin n=2 Tax=Stylophora pistillata TaxID=50429 RepID=A0A2B4RK89_STYPI|nr:Hemolin [Stylophora pistillata]